MLNHDVVKSSNKPTDDDHVQIANLDVEAIKKDGNYNWNHQAMWVIDDPIKNVLGGRLILSQP